MERHGHLRLDDDARESADDERAAEIVFDAAFRGSAGVLVLADTAANIAGRIEDILALPCSNRVPESRVRSHFYSPLR